MATNIARARVTQSISANEKKWGRPLMDAGWTIIPNILLERQQALGLQPLDINILLHIIKYWWAHDRLPFPSKVTIAKCLGVTPRTVQRRIAALEHAGLIKRIVRKDPTKGYQTNQYDFAGLIKEATPYAQERNEERSRRKKEDKERLVRRGKPRLEVVASNEPEA